MVVMTWQQRRHTLMTSCCVANMRSSFFQSFWHVLFPNSLSDRINTFMKTFDLFKEHTEWHGLCPLCFFSAHLLNNPSTSSGLGNGWHLSISMKSHGCCDEQGILENHSTCFQKWPPSAQSFAASDEDLLRTNNKIIILCRNLMRHLRMFSFEDGCWSLPRLGNGTLVTASSTTPKQSQSKNLPPSQNFQQEGQLCF